MTLNAQPDGNTDVQNVPTETPVEGPRSLEEALNIIANLKGINADVIRTRDETKQKLRKYEEEHQQREQALLTEQGKFKELYEATTSQLESLKGALKNTAIDSSLKDTLAKAGVRSVDTVIKLIDKSKIGINDDNIVDITSIQSQLDELKKTDPILFGVGEGTHLPPVKRPSGGDTTSGFEQEMRAAKTQGDILSVMKKYGKI